MNADNITVCIVSMANAHDQRVGGKHIHQLLLEKAYKENNLNVVTVYPSNPSIFARIWTKAQNILFQRYPAEAFIHHCLRIRDNQSKRIKRIVEKTSDEIVFLAHDVISLLAVKDAMGRSGNDDQRRLYTCLTLHGYFTNEEINYQNFEKQRDLFISSSMAWEREAVEFASRIIAVDTRIHNYVVNTFHIDPEKIRTLFNAIDDIVFAPATEEEITYLRRKLALPMDRPIILVARRLVKKNGVINAVKAVEMLPGTLNALMLIVGAGPEHEEIRSFIRFHDLEDKISMLGEMAHEKIVDLYRCADLILLPSTKSDDVEEATSLSMLEGMATGKVVIASAIGGMKEVIENGKTGLLFEDNNIDELALLISNALTDKEAAQRIGKNATEYIKDNNGYRRHAETYLSIAIQEDNT